MRPRLRILFLVALFCLPLNGLAKEDLPEMRGWVNDTAQILSYEDNQKIYSLISELEAKTSAEIAVVTVPSIAPMSEFEYAQALFDKWKIGKRGKDNGILVLLAVAERRWRIHTGYGVEGVLTDAKCSQIGRDQMVPYFKRGKYSEGLYYGVAAIADVIAKDAHVSLDGLQRVKFKKPVKETPVFMYFFMFFFFLLWNIPWPVFIGLPFTCLFGWAMSHSSVWLGASALSGYAGAMMIRYMIWQKMSVDSRKPFWKILVMGLAGTGSSRRGGGYSGGGFSSGGSSGGGSSGGGSSGGGGSGGGF